ncbi:MAG: protein kinase [Leptolyngbyaceae cyanobacterium bins.349]|nr:protein kinase [Leptolyngbyaceae cyanobacterium bins.349]
MMTPLPPGTLVFNRYRVVGLAGQGEFGLTYLAQDQKRFDELCMLREFIPLQSDPAAMELLRQYFHQEAAALYELQHPQLPHYRIMFAHGDRLYLVRDYVVGKSCSAMLNERRAEGRRFTQAEVLPLLLQTLPALAYLHRLGIVHENLCLQSIVIQKDEPLPVLIDLGLVKRLVMQLQLHPVAPNAFIGRVGYAAPEQIKGGEVLPGSDIFALGAIAIALLLGKDPQEPAPRWLKYSNWEAQTSLHPDFARVLKRMLHPHPQKRFVSAQQVLRALEPLASQPLPSDESGVKMPLPVGVPMVPQAAIAGYPHAPVAAPPSLNPTDPPAEAEAAVSPTPPARPRSHPPQRRRSASLRSTPKPRADFKASAILVMSVALLVSVVSFRALSWVQGDSDKTPAPANTIASPPDDATSEANTAPAPDATPSPAMPTRESGASTSGASPSGETAANATPTEIDAQFLSALTDELFYAKHPDLQGQKISPDQKDLQNDWNAISNEVVAKLKQLSPEIQGKLGRYERSDYDRWTAPESGASLNSRELNVLVNNRFGELFPEQKGKSLNPKTFGQVWYALAEEELNKLKPAN